MAVSAYGECLHQRIYILLKTDTTPPSSLTKLPHPTSPRLLCSILHYLSVCITAHRAGGERLGETTTGEWCPFSVGYIFFGSYQYYHHDSNDDKLPQDMNYDVKVTRAIDFPSLKKQVKKTMKTKGHLKNF